MSLAEHIVQDGRWCMRSVTSCVDTKKVRYSHEKKHYEPPVVIVSRKFIIISGHSSLFYCAVAKKSVKIVSKMPSPSLRSPLYSLRRSKRKGTKRGAAASNNSRVNSGKSISPFFLPHQSHLSFKMC
jgi:hypothetical protein